MPVQQPRRRNCIIVLGMHRSGTSAMTGVLSHLGAYPGSALLTAHESYNPKGFWEHAGIVKVHDALLTKLGSSWDDERRLPDLWWESDAAAHARQELRDILCHDFGEAHLWVVKDPRICRLLPVWLHVLREFEDCTPHFLLILRHPVEVAQSLSNRDRIPQHSACVLWLEHMIQAEHWSRGHPRMAVTYAQLLEDWQSTVARIKAELQLPLLTDDPARIENVRRFLEPALRHYQVTTALLSQSPWMRLAVDAFEALSQQAPDRWATMLAPMDAKLSHTMAEIAPWAEQALLLRQRLLRLENRHRQLERGHTALQQEIARIRSSWAWKIATPIRVAEHQLRKLWTYLRHDQHG
jgi:hypothetical protein